MHHWPETNESLILRVKDPADAASWSDFLAIYRPVVVRMACGRGSQHADADDLAQQVFLSVARAIEDWEPDSQQPPFRVWLTRITRNAIVNALTRKRPDAAGGSTSVYLVMTYSRGVSLQKRLNDKGPLEVREILRIGMQAAKGLAAAHAQGIIHRDIKPANIFLDQNVERVQLMDFGLARAVDNASLTRPGTLAGTPQYMSPEQARAETVDHRSDLFSLGSVLYAMCTGHAPFRAESSYSVLRLIIDKEPRPIREINPDIPEHAVMAKLSRSPIVLRIKRMRCLSLRSEVLVMRSWSSTTSIPTTREESRSRLSLTKNYLPY